MVSAALKEGVPEVGEMCHSTLFFGHAQQREVPLAQAVRPRRLLLRGVTIQDVVVTLSQHARSVSILV